MMTIQRLRFFLLYCCLLECSACHGSEAKRVTAKAIASVGVISSVAEARVIERSAYTLRYPVDWNLAEKDEAFDLDHYFSIDGPGTCHVTVVFFPQTLTEKAYLEIQNDTFKKDMFKEAPSEEPFSTWGSLSGSGSQLHGKLKPLGRGRIRNFAHADAKHTLFINEFCFDEDVPVAQPGFDLIERSFRFR